MELNNLIVRAAQPEDKTAVLDFCQHTWADTEDYIAEVWDVWMGDPSGQILVAEFEGRAIAMTRMVQLSDQEGWWEGLRVDPQYRGRGVVRCLDPAIAHYFQSRNISTIRCCVGAWNHAMPPIIKRRGYELVGRYLIHSAEAISVETVNLKATSTKPLKQLTVDDCEQAWQLIQQGKESPLFICRGAKWQTLTRKQLQERLQGGKVWGYWHHPLQGLLIQSHLENEDSVLWVGHIEGNPDGLVGLLEGMKSLAFHLKYPKVSGFFLKTAPLLSALEQAGYSASPTGEFWVYEKRT
ncbi:MULTISPECIES: GNAT family N-acetyltransferase [unclassified Leptolyngbya]|uniref:GNAT family N-acetyltransferase n=1 Tax=unclassified Leptolyngbya TaxID=2650499 RepID=UPI001688B087|nr:MULTISPECIES: GNAT family N-acetyltransferase [unclassified Leptolyngbya]MBD1909388.1 GNAT family N-acetyltransferase [Leptolyngbya sp. FACHB-8]MBD2158665.1 GNAT family N-acetyltransferase [Leptolyngbya sp. FACHB-16]